MNRDLLQRVLARDELAELDPAARRLALRDLLPTPELAADVADAIDGFGPITSLMEDEDVTDVLINGPDEVWVERAGELEPVGVRFSDTGELRHFADRWLSSSGARADAAKPVADATLPDGSRVHVVLPPVASRGPLISIRKFPRSAFDLVSLRDRGMMTDSEHDALVSLVAARRTIVVTGGTGSGKTTLLAALLREIPPRERIVVIEEVAEVSTAGGNHVSLLARPPNVEGRGEIDLRALVRAALRMRPDRIVVGEVRGPEALAALDALSTGHDGSLLTLHARSPAEADDRLVALALAAGSGATEEALRARVRLAVDAVVHLDRGAGRRRVSAIEERR